MRAAQDVEARLLLAAVGTSTRLPMSRSTRAANSADSLIISVFVIARRMAGGLVLRVLALELERRVLDRGEALGLRVRRRLGNGVDLEAALAAARRRVAVQGDEQVRVEIIGLLRAVRERHEGVVRAGEHDVEVAALAQHLRERERGRERDVLLLGAARARGARVLAAVARVDDDDPDGAAWPARRAEASSPPRRARRRPSRPARERRRPGRPRRRAPERHPAPARLPRGGSVSSAGTAEDGGTTPGA